MAFIQNLFYSMGRIFSTHHTFFLFFQFSYPHRIKQPRTKEIIGFAQAGLMPLLYIKGNFGLQEKLHAILILQNPRLESPYHQCALTMTAGKSPYSLVKHRMRTFMVMVIYQQNCKTFDAKIPIVSKRQSKKHNGVAAKWVMTPDKAF